MSWRDYRYFKPSVPRAATGGIKAQSRQGGFGKSWWARRWIAVLDGFQLGARLTRGRSYARNGQVLDIRVESGVITARVQGSRPRPYAVEIQIKTLSKSDEAKLGHALSQQALFAAKLLAGEMPQDIEQALAGTGVSLFPSRLDDLTTGCSCPDWSNPCKHIAAVYYLMGEEFDRDPFLVFKLRGIDRNRLTALLGEQAPPAADRRRGRPSRKRGAESESASASRPSVPRTPAPPPPEPIEPTAAAFWHGTTLPPGWLGEVRTPPLPAALLKRLGSFPFWRGNERFLDALTPVYLRASERAQEALMASSNEGGDAPS